MMERNPETHPASDKGGYGQLEYKQSQTPWEDPDTPIEDPHHPVPRPLTFEEMVYTRKNAGQPMRDMDTDLGA